MAVAAPRCLASSLCHVVLTRGSTMELPTGLGLSALGLGALGVAAALSGWAWILRIADREREGESSILPAQASVSQVVAAVAAAVGLVWVFVGFAQAGMPAVAQVLVGVGTLSSAVVAVVLVRRRRRRQRGG